MYQPPENYSKLVLHHIIYLSQTHSINPASTIQIQTPFSPSSKSILKSNCSKQIVF